MTRLEKDATKRLIILGAVMIAVTTLYIFSRQILPSMAGFAFMGLLGFVKLSTGDGPELNEGKFKKLKLPRYDEREKTIIKNAHSAAFTTFWLIFTIVSVSVSLLMRGQQIPTIILPMQVFVSWWVYTSVYNIAILRQERIASS